MAALNFILMVLLFVLLQTAGSEYAFGMSPEAAAAIVLLNLTSILVLGLVVAFLWVWRRSALPRRGVILYGLFTLVALAFIPWLGYWNLLGLNW